MTVAVAPVLYTEVLDNIDSDVVEVIYYNPESRDLIVALVTNQDEAYVYKNVPAEIWTAFKAANSKGRFYNSYLKGQYQSTTVPDTAVRSADAPVAEASTPASGSLVVRYRVVREEEVVLKTVQDLADFLSDEGISESDLLSVSLNV